MRYNTKALLVITTAVALAAAMIGGVFHHAERTYRGIKCYYAIDQARLMIEDYLLSNEGDWPSSWQDLRTYYDKYDSLGWTNDFEEYKGLVDIDFAFEPLVHLRENPHADSLPPRLVSAKSFKRNGAWEALDEVNRRLMAAIRTIHVDD